MDLATPPQSPQPKNVRVSAIAKKALKRVRSPTKTYESPLEKRKPGSHSDLPLEVRQAAVAEYRAALGPALLDEMPDRSNHTCGFASSSTSPRF